MRKKAEYTLQREPEAAIYASSSYGRSRARRALSVEPIKQTLGGTTYLMPPFACLASSEDGTEVRGQGIVIGPTKSGDDAVLAIPESLISKNTFVPITSLKSLYHLVHMQKWEGVVVPHDTHTLAAERGQAPYAEYVQVATFAKVMGEMKHPGTGETVPCAVLNLRMPRETYGGQLWWVIGGHNIPHESGTKKSGVYTRSASSLGGTLRKEGAEEALVVCDESATEVVFDPLEKGNGRRVRVLGFGRSSDRVGRMHVSVIVAVHLRRGERLVVRAAEESLGFMQVPLAEWMRFMQGALTESDQCVIRESIIRGLAYELNRTSESARADRQSLIDRQLTLFFGPRNSLGERTAFHLSPGHNTPPIDRLSLTAARELSQCWRLLS